ncbi:MAG: hypothetical protein IH793_12360 [Acidobacteria bacterium]|nr:hypothetical protein [Acidobacteriota bacterium]
MDFDTLDMARLRGLAGNKWRRYGDAVLPAWVADMDFLQAAPIRDYVTRAGATGDLGYPFAEGPEPLQAIFAERAAQKLAAEPVSDHDGGFGQRVDKGIHPRLKHVKAFATGGGTIEFHMGALRRDAFGQVLEDIGFVIARLDDTHFHVEIRHFPGQ